MPDTTASPLGILAGETEAESYPAELDPFTTDRIEHDWTWYGQFLDPDMFFFEANEENLYTMTAIHSEYTFDMLACATAGADTDSCVPAGAESFIDNICTLAGDYEIGDTIPLPPGELRQIGEWAFLNVDGFVLRFPNEGIISRLRDWLEMEEKTDITLGRVRSKVETSTTPTAAAPDDITVYYPPHTDEPGTRRTDAALPDAQTHTTRQFSSENLAVETRFVPVQEFSKWTFDDPSIKQWVEELLDGTVLNACAGKTHLHHNDTIYRNDINTDRPADTHVDAAELAAHYPAESFETILFNPPWSFYQSNPRYDGEHVTKGTDTSIDTTELPFDIPGGREKTQLGHARLCKDGFDYLLKPGGTVIQLTFHGTCMPSRLGYERQERVVFDPVGEAKSVIGSVDRKTQYTFLTGDK